MTKYRHYKGEVYTKIGDAVAEGDKLVVVVYEDKYGSWWTRPYHEFHGLVERHSEVIKRFEELEE